VLTLLLAILNVFVTERYRLTALPGLVVLAVSGLALLVAECRARRWVGPGLFLIAGVGAAFLVFAPRESPELKARRDYAVGLRLIERVQQLRDPAERASVQTRGVEFLRRAQKLVPTDAEVAFGLANGLLVSGATQEAEQYYRGILAAVVDKDRRPAHLGSLNNLGSILLDAKRYAEAEPVFMRSLQLDRENGLAWFRLAQVELGLGKPDLARRALADALRVEPKNEKYKAFAAEIERAAAAPKP
jgi:tetratricopeptide (TPR) repeat protein